jgi:hypothetical protein
MPAAIMVDSGASSNQTASATAGFSAATLQHLLTGILAMYPKKSAIWPVSSSQKLGTITKEHYYLEKTFFFKQLSSLLTAQSQLGFPKT